MQTGSIVGPKRRQKPLKSASLIYAPGVGDVKERHLDLFFLSSANLFLLIPPLPSKHGRGAVRLDDSEADGRELARQQATNNERACKLKQTKPLSAPPKAGSLPPATLCR
ncbi:Hypothetical predicted protein [Xyrichtys novacula]|uniref:Uncharacterized protein n=1 Tax=Xyrichtys novacula TaxID=13765 RepID=A0AAV1GBR2_XYRNO|nr:Hypothetical predicted protein [Xyrichtys novacula]